MEPFRHHVFVCTQQKAEGVPCCAAHRSHELLEKLQRELSSRRLDQDVQVTSCGCLGTCDHGPMVLVYPEGVWYSGVTPTDVPDIVASHLARGKVLTRLARSDAEAMKAEILDHRKQYLAMLKAKDEAGVLPDDIDSIIRGYWPSRAVLTALELDLFSAVGDGASAMQVAAVSGTDERATEMLLNALVSLGLLIKKDNVFDNSPESKRFFTSGSTDNARPGLLHIANLWNRWSNLTDCVRTGTCVPVRTSTDWTQSFMAAMHRNARQRAASVVKTVGAEKIGRMLDLGGGSGAYSIAFAAANPELTAEILDVPDVVPIAERNIRAAGLSERIKVRDGDMLSTELGNGFDLVFLSAICHMFSPDENRKLFARARAALAKHGRLVIQDFILEPDKTSPRFGAMFSLNMLVSTKGGASYSQTEYESWLLSAGFSGVRHERLPGPANLIIASPAVR